MKKIMILASLLSIVALSGCAVSKNVYDLRDYCDPVFENNYYREKDESIVDNISEKKNVELDKSKDKVFETYDELKTLRLDEDVNADKVTYDTMIHSNVNTTYGTSKCLGNYDDSFNYGMLSKLTDGLLFCDQKTFQGVRVQIDKDGFVQKYDKSICESYYFALSFKAGSDFTNPSYPGSAQYDIKLNIKFYSKAGNSYIENGYSYSMDNVIRDRYYLFGFVLPKDLVIDGFGISYEIINSNEDASIKHCLHLYETLYVNPTIKN